VARPCGAGPGRACFIPSALRRSWCIGNGRRPARWAWRLAPNGAGSSTTFPLGWGAAGLKRTDQGLLLQAWMDRRRRSSTRTFVPGPCPRSPSAEVPVAPLPLRVIPVVEPMGVAFFQASRADERQPGRTQTREVSPCPLELPHVVKSGLCDLLRCGMAPARKKSGSSTRRTPASRYPRGPDPMQPVFRRRQLNPTFEPHQYCRRTAPNLRNFPSGGTLQPDARTTLQRDCGRAAQGWLRRFCRSCNISCPSRGMRQAGRGRGIRSV